MRREPERFSFSARKAYNARSQPAASSRTAAGSSLGFIGGSLVVVVDAAIHHSARARRQHDEHLESLELGMLAWCHGLAATGVLQETLERRGIEWHGEGDGILLEPQVLS